MKKRFIQLVLILGLMTLTCVAAQASESSATSGFRNFTVEAAYKDYVSLTPLDASGRTAKPDENDAYPGAAKVGVTYQRPQSGSEYLLIVLSDAEPTPSVDNMAYIDQKTAGSADLDFDVYLKKTDEKSVTYSVYMSSNVDAGEDDSSGVTAYVKVGSFEYYNEGLGDVKLGDVDGDGEILVTDAVMVLQNVVEILELDEKQTAAADVDKSGEVEVPDAVAILQYVVEAISSFDDL